MTLLEIHEAFRAEGPVSREVLEQLGEHVDRLSKEAVCSFSGRWYRLKPDEREEVRQEAWRTIARRYQAGLSQAYSEDGLSVYIKKILGSCGMKLRKVKRQEAAADQAIREGLEAGDDGAPRASEEGQEESSDQEDDESITKALWQRAWDVVAPVADELVRTSRKSDRASTAETVRDLKRRVLEGKTTKELLLAKGLITEATPKAAFKKLENAYLNRSVRLRDRLEALALQRRASGIMSERDAALFLQTLRVLIRKNSPTDKQATSPST